MGETTTDPDKQLTLEMAFIAPIELVFDALTLPEHLQHWHCPDHLQITSTESNPEVGGEYRIGVTADGASEMAFLGRYLEIDRPDRLVYTQAFSMGEDGPVTPETRITISLTQEGDRTLMQFCQSGFDSTRSLEGAKMSWPQIYGKLNSYLEGL